MKGREGEGFVLTCVIFHSRAKVSSFLVFVEREKGSLFWAVVLGSK